VDIPAGFVESYRVLEDKRRTLAYFHDDADLYLLGLPPGGIEILRGKDQIQPEFEENIAGRFKMQVELFSVVDDAVAARTTTWHDFTREITDAPVEAPE
jgi:hypothetical protein